MVLPTVPLYAAIILVQCLLIQRLITLYIAWLPPFSRYLLRLFILLGSTVAGTCVFHWDPLAEPIPQYLTINALRLQHSQGQPYFHIGTSDSSLRLFILWRSDCQACMEQLQQIALKSYQQPQKWLHTNIISVSQDNDLLSTLRGIKALPFMSPMLALRDPSQRMMAALGQHTLPLTLLINERDEVVWSHRGGLSSHDWKQLSTLIH